MNTDEAIEIRETLRPFMSSRIEVEGTVSRISKVYDYKARRDVPSVCLNNVEIREGHNHPVINHVWVTWALLLINSGVRDGDVVRLTAQVYQYSHRNPDDHNQVEIRYGLREPRDVRCLNRTLRPDDDTAAAEDDDARVLAAAPTVRPGDDNDVPEPGPAPAVPESTNGQARAVTAVMATDPKRELFDRVYDLTARFGMDQVKRTLSAVEMVQNS